jgi:phage FluMu protein Com
VHTLRAEGYTEGKKMETIRCGQCDRKLAEADYIRLSIKCPRCGAINQMKAQEPLTRAARPPRMEANNGKGSVQTARQKRV